MESILVSACLLGLCCRYDGKSKPNARVLQLCETEHLIPFCPEIYGGLPTPREPAEIIGDRVFTKDGKDLTDQYQKGAQEALQLALLNHCTCAILQSNSPSCGSGFIYDGSFTGAKVRKNGITAQLLLEHGIRVITPSAL